MWGRDAPEAGTAKARGTPDGQREGGAHAVLCDHGDADAAVAAREILRYIENGFVTFDGADHCKGAAHRGPPSSAADARARA